MCKHYEVDENGDVWAYNRVTKIRVQVPWDEVPKHIYPKYPAPVVIDEDGKQHVQVMRWGFLPRFKKEYLTNARNDGLLTRPTWKEATAQRRCLIPATGYYEPGPGPTGARGEVRFTIRERQRFFIAGLWEQDPDGSGTRAFTMVTTTPNEYAARFHDRMPVVLDDAGALAWLGSSPLPDEQIAALCQPPAVEIMEHQVIAAVPRGKKSITRDDLKSADGELSLF